MSRKSAYDIWLMHHLRKNWLSSVKGFYRIFTKTCECHWYDHVLGVVHWKCCFLELYEVVKTIGKVRILVFHFGT